MCTRYARVMKLWTVDEPMFRQLNWSRKFVDRLLTTFRHLSSFHQLLVILFDIKNVINSACNGNWVNGHTITRKFYYYSLTAQTVTKRSRKLNRTGYKTVSTSVSSVEVWLEGCSRVWSTLSEGHLRNGHFFSCYLRRRVSWFALLHMNRVSYKRIWLNSPMKFCFLRAHSVDCRTACRLLCVTRY